MQFQNWEGTWTWVLAPNQEAVYNWYPLSKENQFSSMRCCWNTNYSLGQAPWGDGEGGAGCCWVGCDPGEFQGMDHASSWGHCCSSRGAQPVWGCAGALCTQSAVPYLRLECPAEDSKISHGAVGFEPQLSVRELLCRHLSKRKKGGRKMKFLQAGSGGGEYKLK